MASDMWPASAPVPAEVHDQLTTAGGPGWLAICSYGWNQCQSGPWAAKSICKLHRRLAATGEVHVPSRQRSRSSTRPPDARGVAGFTTRTDLPLALRCMPQTTAPCSTSNTTARHGSVLSPFRHADSRSGGVGEPAATPSEHGSVTRLE
jgi:hypothetical protein